MFIWRFTWLLLPLTIQILNGCSITQHHFNMKLEELRNQTENQAAYNECYDDHQGLQEILILLPLKKGLEKI